MKVSVWTSLDQCGPMQLLVPKCIFIGEIASVPAVGEYVVLRDGFGAEHVTSVIHDLVSGEIEMQIANHDPDNDYGPCLFRKEEPK